MKAFKELDLQGLHWQQVKSHYELRDDQEHVIATMHRPKWWKSSVEVDGPGNRWHFERRGFFRYHIEITSVGTGEAPAVFRYGPWGTGGTLAFNDGRSFQWKQVNFWGNKWGWLDADENPVMAFDAGGVFRANAALSFDEDADFPALLLFLGGYLYTLYIQDASGATASISTATLSAPLP